MHCAYTTFFLGNIIACASSLSFNDSNKQDQLERT